MSLEDQRNSPAGAVFSLLSGLLSPTRGLRDVGSQWAVCSTDLGLRARVIKVTDRVCILSQLLAFSVALSWSLRLPEPSFPHQ